jgi:hypothetical protein
MSTPHELAWLYEIILKLDALALLALRLEIALKKLDFREEQLN